MPTLIVTVPEVDPGLAQTLSSVRGADTPDLVVEVLIALQGAATSPTRKERNTW